MVSFKRLTRGIKLLVEHLFTPLSDVRTQLVTTGLGPAELETNYSTFRLNLYIPYVNQGTKAEDRDRYGTVTAPFILPAPQDEFTLNNALIEDYELTEVSIGFDSRSEPKNLAGCRADAAQVEEGLLLSNDLFGYTLHITEKMLDGSGDFLGDPYKNEVYKLEMAPILLSDVYRRANPHVQSDLSVPFRHDRSYLMEFVPSKSGATVAVGVGFFSLNVSLKFKRLVMNRDGATTQNIPTHAGALNPPAVTITAPASNSVIAASGATGVQTNYQAIDSLVAGGLRGGYLRSAEREDDETIRSSAGYDVIAVPLFGGYSVGSSGPLGGIAPNMKDCTYTAVSMPYSTAGAGNFQTMDRAIIPLHYPVTVHHVLIARSYTGPNGSMSSARPVSATQPNLTNEVGVGLLTGIRSDNFDVTQVAHCSWTPGTLGLLLVDRANLAFEPSSPTTQFVGYAWDILSCPLVGAVASPGSGYFTQGSPIFAGQGTTPTETRSNVDGVAPPTLGAEQALDIRWKISDIVGDPAAAPGGSVVVGWPCHWVYIICKKHLV